MRVHDSLPEPSAPGSVVRIEDTGSKYPEIWIASYINIGRWYPDSESMLTGTTSDLPEGARFDQLQARGTVTLLTGASRETFETGWQAACRSIRDQADDLQYECPDEEA